MKISEITKKYQALSAIESITSALKDHQKIYVSGLKGSSSSIVLGAIFKQSTKNMVIALSDKEQAAYFYNDLQAILDADSVEFLPSSYQRSIQYGRTEGSNILLRTDVLNKISNATDKIAIVTYPEALMEKVIPPDRLASNTFTIKKDDALSMDFVIELLTEYDFERSDFVYAPGQYAVRGSLIDVFSYAGEEPFRLDFFGDNIDSIRYFDIETQLTISNPQKVTIIPNIQEKLEDEPRISMLDFINKNTSLAFSDLKFCVARIDQIIANTNADENNDLANKNIHDTVISGKVLLNHLNNQCVLEFGQGSYYKTKPIVAFDTALQPALRKNFDLLANSWNQFTKQGYTNYILSSNPEQIDRLSAIFADRETKAEFKSINQTLNEGFIDHSLKITCFTDHQIFERFHKFNIRTGFTKRESLTIAELTNLHPGDYVVHIDHGIGKFGGLHKAEINGKMQETIKLVYRDNDVLFVSIHSLHRISKYKGKDTDQPMVHKLGSAVWQNLKAKTKSQVKDIAKDLIKLYAERKALKGFAFSADSFMNQELEASFIYEDTPDQQKATKAVKADMENLIPMDRLICGDVGFGKTEIAIRAAFKSVADNKQVAVLVPTTILALQHFKTFSERLKDFPCNVDYISRLRKSKDQTEIIKKLKKGEIDILIGTHKLISKEIVFKDLGLLVVDEEQKFGVSVKEKLKQLKTNVDTLTLTATPIPRTLQFSLMGARDLSIINTPPPNRQSILTELHTFNEAIIQEAINYEINRNGQVFFLHNRVQSLPDIIALIAKLCPNAKATIAHGQMEGQKLENIMLDFIEGKYDVLVATTIIESGLDIPNANTIIINQAQNYGLSDLHQLRGRVGRSNRKAFCYLLAPPESMLTNEARRRLKAIEDFSELGSGFNIALQDLDIRGAGNLLGAEQSGFIGDLGFEAYQKILDEALLELKQNELKDLFSHSDENLSENETSEETYSSIRFVNDCFIDTDLELLFPDDYIENIPERINLYRKLDSIENEEELILFEKGLVDRFGPMPKPTHELLKIVRLRWMAIQLGMERVLLKNNKMTAYFVSNENSIFYQSQTFQHIMMTIQNSRLQCQMQEKNNKLTLTYDSVSSVEKALETLKIFILNNLENAYSQSK